MTRKAVGVLQRRMFESFHDQLRSLLCLLALLRWTLELDVDSAVELMESCHEVNARLFNVPHGVNCGFLFWCSVLFFFIFAVVFLCVQPSYVSAPSCSLHRHVRSSSILVVRVLDEVGHDQEALEGLLTRGDDLACGQQEPEVSSVTELNRVGVLDTCHALGPVVRSSSGSILGREGKDSLRIF